MNKTAVISGVGAGLGASLARKFAREGYQVALLARSADYLEALAAEIQTTGATAKGFPTDIGDPQKVGDSFAQIREQFGKVDILVLLCHLAKKSLVARICNSMLHIGQRQTNRMARDFLMPIERAVCARTS